MAYINMADPRISYGIPYESSTSSPQGPYKLKRINNFGGMATIIMNGFTWTGDKGLVDGGIGVVDGYVVGNVYQGKYTGMGNNNLGGGYVLYPNWVSAGTKFNMYYPPNQPKGTPLSFLNSSYGIGGESNGIQVSSSTSVVLDGKCNTPGTVSRWSAIGWKPGVMVMMSSTSDSTTQGSDLCPVFQAVGINNALRLDGGPSAIMGIDGVVKNPLTGTDFIKYGSMRYIAYPIYISSKLSAK